MLSPNLLKVLKILLSVRNATPFEYLILVALLVIGFGLRPSVESKEPTYSSTPQPTQTSPAASPSSTPSGRDINIHINQTQMHGSGDSHPSPDQMEIPIEEDPYAYYMNCGYEADEQQKYEVALQYFELALAERPGDKYAKRAIQNMRAAIKRHQ